VEDFEDGEAKTTSDRQLLLQELQSKLQLKVDLQLQDPRIN